MNAIFFVTPAGHDDAAALFAAFRARAGTDAAVTVVAGARGREKRLAVAGLDVASACARLAPFVDKGGTPD